MQIEYAGVPESCRSCDLGEKFVLFLLKPEIQKIIMEHNYMLPARPAVATGTMFDKLPTVKTLPSEDQADIIKRREELLDRWRQLGL